MEILICNWNQQAHSTVNYRINRQGTIKTLRPHTDNSIIIAIDNDGPVLQVIQDGHRTWKTVQLDQNGNHTLLPTAKEIRVPYEFCTCHPFKHWLHYEYIPIKQINALQHLLNRLQQELQTIHPILASQKYQNRRDPHPQIELKRLLKQYAS